VGVQSGAANSKRNGTKHFGVLENKGGKKRKVDNRGYNSGSVNRAAHKRTTGSSSSGKEAGGRGSQLPGRVVSPAIWITKEDTEKKNHRLSGNKLTLVKEEG